MRGVQIIFSYSLLVKLLEKPPALGFYEICVWPVVGLNWLDSGHGIGIASRLIHCKVEIDRCAVEFAPRRFGVVAITRERGTACVV